MRVTSPVGSILRRMSVSMSHVGVWNAFSARNFMAPCCLRLRAPARSARPADRRTSPASSCRRRGSRRVRAPCGTGRSRGCTARPSTSKSSVGFTVADSIHCMLRLQVLESELRGAHRIGVADGLRLVARIGAERAARREAQPRLRILLARPLIQHRALRFGGANQLGARVALRPAARPASAR